MVDSVRTGIEIVGLSGTLRALGRANPKLKAEAKDVLRDGARTVQSVAQGRIGSGGYRLGKQSGMIGRSVTAKGAGLRLRASKYPWAYAAEYGEVVAHVYGKPIAQSRFKTRTAARFKPPTSVDMEKNRGGYMIQPAIKLLLPALHKDAGIRLTKVLVKAMKVQGAKVR